MKFFFGLLLLCLVGCTRYNDPSVMARNATAISGEGEYIGALPDGRKIHRYCIDMGDSHDHWLYVTNGSITINRDEKNGKHTNNHVDVIIDGVHYTPAR